MNNYKVKMYSQAGEGVVFKDKTPIYVYGAIVGEIIQIEIFKEKKTFKIARIIKIIETSENRVEHNIQNVEKIGGYELLHMNKKEQANFKKYITVNSFKKIAQEDLDDIEIIQGKKTLRYRNKITLNNGCFHEKNSHNSICLEDFLLTDIKPKTSKDGEIIIRKLDTTISGNKANKLFTTDTMLGYKFRISLGSFYQINKEIAEMIYKKIQSFVIKKSNVLDLYTGIATIAIIISGKAKSVIALERNKRSFNDAKWNLKRNNIRNVEIIKQDVKYYLNNVSNKFDIIIVDPAREGLGENICQKLLQMKPKKIIYLSCNPGTQAADYNRLKSEYKITYKKIYDMFPQTHHIENLIVLEKIK